jgi:hypothetical protein
LLPHYLELLVLIEPASIAIWNRNKAVVALATSAWLTYLTFIIQGKSLSLFSLADEREPFTSMVWYQESHR